ncbi:hypothetical protein B0H10DRAFT_1764831, partial [Mycena sp. CBHHK59/15]
LWDTLDVDQECLEILEHRMFEISPRAGQAGKTQWGLDAGVHQGQCFPYQNLPSEWSYDSLEITESDVE